MQPKEIKLGSRWFRRLYRECKQLSPQMRFVRVRYGFWRIYFKNAYIHEVYQEMPELGYDIEDLDPRFEEKNYFEEWEDKAELTRKIKNYVEGYWDSIGKIRRSVYMMKHDKEFNKNATEAYRLHRVK